VQCAEAYQKLLDGRELLDSIRSISRGLEQGKRGDRQGARRLPEVKYQVIVTPDAQAGIRESFIYIHERSPLNAARWLETVLKKDENRSLTVAAQNRH